MAITTQRKPVILGLKQGRGYDCGTMSAVFKVDRPEVGDRYSVSEWWLEPGSKGPTPHSLAENDRLFFVIEGLPSILVGDTWYDSPVGSFVMVPATVTHGFENRTDARAGLLSVFVPGGFEDRMPAVVEWFRNNQS